MQTVSPLPIPSEPQEAAAESRAGLARITDIYLPLAHDPEQDDPRSAFCYSGSPTVRRLTELGLEDEWTAGLYAAVRAQRDHRRDFRVQYDGLAFRARRDRAVDGDEVALRRLPSAAPLLSDLTIRPGAIADLLLHPWLNRGGLVLLAALTGQGKSTTVAATIKQRLIQHGGRCVTIEDPIELPLHGIWGQGSCGQFEVTYDNPNPLDDGFAGGIRGALRKMPATKPAIIFVGEIRDAETAVEAIKAAVSGAVLIATIHAESRVGALQRLVALAERDLGAAAPMLVASALRVVAHQHLHLEEQGTGWGRGVIQMDTLFCGNERHAVAIAVREKRFHALGDIEQQQSNRLRLAMERGATPSDILGEFEIRP